MKSVLHITSLIISIFVSTNNAARILGVFPMPAISHQAPFRRITQELARRGHDVTVITPLPAFAKGQAPKNLREIDVHEITYLKWAEQMNDFPSGSKDDVSHQLKNLMHYITVFAEIQILAPEVQELIKNKNETFDLLLVEHCVRPALVFSHLYKVPVIQISSFGAMISGHEFIGSSTHPLLYPVVLQQKLFDMTLMEKITAIRSHYSYMTVSHEQEKIENDVIRRIFGDSTSSVSELQDNVAMIFLNVHPIWEDNRPVPPNVIYMGGVHQKPEKELPQDLKSYLDSSKHGVIYFSFGTSVTPSTLPPETIQVYLNAFSKLPYDILWKYDKDELPGKPYNVRTEKWLPQADLLRHPKVKLFITQAGLQSTDEAITAGVPMIAIPMLGDQWYNAQRYVHHKIGLELDSETITEESFKHAVETVISDESYRQNIKKLRAVMNDQPERPLERAVWWTEHVLRHGGASHLRSPAMNMPLAQYYEIKLVLMLLFTSLLAVFLVLYSVFSLWRYIGRNYTASVKIKKA